MSTVEEVVKAIEMFDRYVSFLEFYLPWEVNVYSYFNLVDFVKCVGS